MSASARTRSQPARAWSALASLVLAGSLVACTRFEDQVILSLHAKSGCRLTWSSIARRGVNLVDASGNVGSASATFACRADASAPDRFVIAGDALHWSASGAAARRLGPRADGGWSGSVQLAATGDARRLVLDLRDGEGRPFVGNRRYEDVKGNGETWIAR